MQGRAFDICSDFKTDEKKDKDESTDERRRMDFLLCTGQKRGQRVQISIRVCKCVRLAFAAYLIAICFSTISTSTWIRLSLALGSFAVCLCVLCLSIFLSQSASIVFSGYLSFSAFVSVCLSLGLSLRMLIRWHEFENQGIIQRWPWVKIFLLMSSSRIKFLQTIKTYAGDGLGLQSSDLLRIC